MSPKDLQTWAPVCDFFFKRAFWKALKNLSNTYLFKKYTLSNDDNETYVLVFIQVVESAKYQKG